MVAWREGYGKGEERKMTVSVREKSCTFLRGKILNRPKEMNAVSTKVLLRFSPPVCPFAPFIFTLSWLGRF